MTHRTSVDRTVLLVIFLTSSLSLISYRFHFLVRNYDTFVIRQLIPASGLQGWLGGSFGYDPSAYAKKAARDAAEPKKTEAKADDAPAPAARKTPDAAPAPGKGTASKLKDDDAPAPAAGSPTPAPKGTPAAQTAHPAATTPTPPAAAPSSAKLGGDEK